MAVYPATTFPQSVDPALVQNANFKDNKAYRARVDAQILALQAFAITLGSYPVVASASLSTQQIATQGIILVGSPSGAATLTLPTVSGQLFARLVLNTTSYTMTLAASTGGTTPTIASGVLAWVVFDGVNLWVQTPGGGGGGGGGPTLETTLYATPGSPIARTSAWMRVPFDTTIAPSGFTVPTTAVLGDIVGSLDAGKCWGTHAFTFNGGSYLVEDPFNQVPGFAATWVSPPGFNSPQAVEWQLITDANVNSGNPAWRAV